MIKYEYFEEGKLLITKYSGDIDNELLKAYVRFIFTQTDCTSLVNLLSDFRDSNMLFNPNDLKDIAETRKKVDVNTPKKRTVILVDKPRETALVALIAKLYNQMLNPADFCSTLQVCIQSLKLNISPAELDERLNNLKFHFPG